MSHGLKRVWPTGKYFVAECECGWQSPLVHAEYAARTAYAQHAEKELGK